MSVCERTSARLNTDLRLFALYPARFLLMCPWTLFLGAYGIIGLFFWDPVKFETDALAELVISLLITILSFAIMFIGQKNKTGQLMAALQVDAGVTDRENYEALDDSLMVANSAAAANQASAQQPQLATTTQAQLAEKLKREQHQLELKTKSWWERLVVLSALFFFIISYAAPTRQLIEVCDSECIRFEHLIAQFRIRECCIYIPKCTIVFIRFCALFHTEWRTLSSGCD